jgi:thymidylate kinase
MFVALIPSIVFWQLQEFVRRVMYTEHRFGAAFLNDIISYGGQTVAIAALYAARVAWHHPFTGAMALYALAWTSAAAVVVGAWQIRHSLASHIEPHGMRENWHFGKWLAGGELMGYCSSLHMQVLWAAWLIGTAASADLRAAQILLGPTRVIAFFLGTVLPIRFARTLHTGGLRALHAQIRGVYTILVPIVGIYCLALALFPGPLLRLVYGSHYVVSTAAIVLILCAICSFINYMQMVITAALTAARQTRYIFVSSAVGCCIALLMSPICIRQFGAPGSIVSMILTTLVVTSMLAMTYRKHLRLAEGIRMIATDTPVMERPITPLPAAPLPARAVALSRGELLARVFKLFDDEGLRYCVLHGYESFPQQVNGDVDLLVERAALPARLATLLRHNEETLGASVVQWFEDRAHFIVLCARGEDDTPLLLQLHVSTDYDVRNRLIYAGKEVIRTRRRQAAGFWAPAGHVEFACVLANRVAKGKLDAKHERKLTQLWRADREGCGAELFRLFNQDSTRRIADAAEAGNWGRVQAVLPSLRRELLLNGVMRQPGSYLSRLAAQQGRRLQRWIMPRSGLHVVFLGPDGVGKSTVIEAVQERVSPAFLKMKYQTFARGLLPSKPKPSPHALPPRSLVASLVKAAWWALCYTIGYVEAVHPTRCGGGLVINHRYLLDAMVDPKRYRYAGPAKLLSRIWTIAPKPDLIIVLDAPAEVIQQRKQETTLEETARQCEAYRTLAGSVANAVLVDASQSPQQTVEQVTGLIFGQMNARIGRRFGTA